MSMKKILVLAGMAIGLCGVALGADGPATATAPAATRPAGDGQLVIEPRTHDPSMIREGNTYYVFNTGRGIQEKRSTDLIHWEYLPSVFRQMPEWTATDFARVGSIWAPDISFFNGEYHLYYCVSNFGRNRSAIGLATSKTLDPTSPDYKWVDHGKVFESFMTDSYNAIDPSIAMDGDGKPWLTFGSFWSGIKLKKLVAATGMPEAGDKELYSLATRPQSTGRSIEAPCIVHRGAFYYLFVSFDVCCRGAASTYRTMVGRSAAITGPYVDQAAVEMLKGGGTVVIAGDPNGGGRGPGGGVVVQDGDRWLLVHHFYDADARGTAKLQIRPLLWNEDGWPVAGAALGEPAK